MTTKCHTEGQGTLVHMQKCCYEGTCFDNFKDLPQRIENLNGKPLFDYMHESLSGMIINKVPKGTKWNDFLYDYWDYTSPVRL